MKAAFFMLAGCAVLSGCATRVPQAPQPILARAVTRPSPISGTTKAPLNQTNEVDLTKRYIRISGGVARPGFYPLGPNTSTLMRALGAAEPLFANWQADSLLEIHRENGSVETYRFRKIAAERTNDPTIYPNDHIHVPRKSAFGW